VLLLASPVFSLGGGLIPKILSMVGNLVLSVLREEEPVPEAPVLMLLLFESDIGKPRVIGGEEEVKKRLERTMKMK